MRRAPAAAVLSVLLCVPLVSAAPQPPDPARITALASGADPATRRLGERLRRALDSYGRLRDYRAVFLKREKDKTGALADEERILLKFEKPFKIYMGWLNTSKKGLQVMYERGKHDDKLVIHKPGLAFGLAPVIFLPRDSPWVREGSAAYDIEDAGIGTFLYDFAVSVVEASEKGMLKTELSTTGEGWIEVSFPGTVKDSVFFAYRVKVFFDDATGLPVRMQLYDWHNQPTGTYAYEDLRVDIGADDPEFNRHVHRKLRRIYTGNRV